MGANNKPALGAVPEADEAKVSKVDDTDEVYELVRNYVPGYLQADEDIRKEFLPKMETWWDGRLKKAIHLALIGDTGVGKSKLWNSIIALAKQSGPRKVIRTGLFPTGPGNEVTSQFIRATGAFPSAHIRLYDATGLNIGEQAAEGARSPVEVAAKQVKFMVAGIIKDKSELRWKTSGEINPDIAGFKYHAGAFGSWGTGARDDQIDSVIFTHALVRNERQIPARSAAAADGWVHRAASQDYLHNTFIEFAAKWKKVAQALRHGTPSVTPILVITHMDMIERMVGAAGVDTFKRQFSNLVTETAVFYVDLSSDVDAGEPTKYAGCLELGNTNPRRRALDTELARMMRSALMAGEDMVMSRLDDYDGHATWHGPSA